MESTFSKFLTSDLETRLIRTLIDNTPVAYIILDKDYRIYYINDNFLKLRKLDPELTLGELCYNISNKGVPCRQCAVKKALQTGEKAFITRRDTLPDGSTKFIDDYAIPLLKDDKGEVQFVLEIMVDRTVEMRSREQRDADYDEILSILSSLLDAKDSYTATHSSSVRTVAFALAKAMNLPRQEIFDIAMAASLHDIGKVRIPDSIINKPGRLTEEEFHIIQGHPKVSYDMVADLSSFENIKNIVRGHHERYDGRGYPDGLAGAAIPLGARIVAVADTYDAITSTRSYRKALTHEFALEEIAKGAGEQFDPEIVRIFLNMDFNADGVLEIGAEQSQTIDRVIEAPSMKSEKNVVSFAGEARKKINLDAFVQKIFDNTPCGYVLMNTDRRVLYASKYFLDYMGLAEEGVINRRCYQIATEDGIPCSPCAIELSLKSGKPEYMRMTQKTNNGWKTFDLYGMPLAGQNGKVENVIEIIIDRTEEVLLEKRREEDFTTLIDTLTGILEEQEREAEKPELSGHIVALRDRLKMLMAKGLGG